MNDVFWKLGLFWFIVGVSIAAGRGRGSPGTIKPSLNNKALTKAGYYIKIEFI